MGGGALTSRSGTRHDRYPATGGCGTVRYVALGRSDSRSGGTVRALELIEALIADRPANR